MSLFNKVTNPKKEKELLMTKSIPFSVEESYKALRTNLIFALPEAPCKIIEITSASQHEGKSVTAINLAIALAKNGEKVILIDCDLRLTTIAKKLKMRQKPGLTNLLFGLNDSKDVIYHHPCGIDVIPAGELPPNPSETLGSSRMATLLDFLKQHYTYVILDMPPIGVVTDAAVLAPLVSGIILVVRQGHTRYEGIDDAIRKLTIANGNILGFVLTNTTLAKKSYSKYGYDTYSKT